MNCPNCKNKLLSIKRAKNKANPLLNSSLFYYCDRCDEVFSISNKWVVIFLLSLWGFSAAISFKNYTVCIIFIIIYFFCFSFLNKLIKKSKLELSDFSLTSKENYSFDDLYDEFSESLSKLSVIKVLLLIVCGFLSFLIVYAIN